MDIRNGVKNVRRKAVMKVMDSKEILQVIPDTTVINGIKVESISRALYSLHKTPLERLRWKKGLKYIIGDNISYEVLMEAKKDKTEITFYYVVPKRYRSVIYQNIETTWPKSTIETVEEYITDFDWGYSEYTEIVQKEHFFKSLLCDRRTLAPIPSVLGVSKELVEGDKLLLQIILDPVDGDWREKADDYWQAFRRGEDVSKKLNAFDKIMDGIGVTFENIFGAMDILLDMQPDMTKETEEKKLRKFEKEKLKLKEYTNQKIRHDGFKGTIRAICQSKDEMRRRRLIDSLAVALKDANGDNELVKLTTKSVNVRMMDKIKKRIGMSHNNNIYSTDEVTQLIQLPTAEYQKEYNIERIDTKEVAVPEPLLKGYMRLGTARYKTFKDIMTYFPSDFDDASKPIAIFGPSGGGKSKFSENLLADICNNTNHSLVLFDYIDNCQLSKMVISNTKEKDKVVIIRFDNSKVCPAMDFPEIPIDMNDDPEKIIDQAYNKALALKSLINNIQLEGTNDFSTRMEKYLKAAGVVVLWDPNEKIINVSRVLEDHKVRKKYIDKALQAGVLAEDDDFIIHLKELDKYGTTNKDKHLVIDTYDKANFILDRFSKLTGSRHCQKMIKSSNSINFVDLLEQGKIIIFQMPEAQFMDHGEKDLIVSCMLAKVWCAQKTRSYLNDTAGKDRKDLKISHIYMDEIHQIPGAMRTVADFIVEVRKYGGNYIFTAQDTIQFGALQRAIAATGCNYVIIKGTDADIVKELAKDLKPHFTVEDVDTIKKWHSVNVIRLQNERHVFVTHLPPILEH